MNRLVLLRRIVVHAGLLLALAAETQAQQAGMPVRADLDEFTVVECVLPGRMVQQGMRRTYMTGGRVIRATPKECAVAGGSFFIEPEGQLKRAYNIWLEPAKGGNAQAQYYLGEILERGVNGRPDYAEAANWYRRAADQGDHRAAIALGRFYDQGLGVPADKQEAARWVQRATGIPEDVLKSYADRIVSDRVAQLEQELSLRQQEVESLRHKGATDQAAADRAAKLERDLAARQREVEELRRKGTVDADAAARIARLEQDLAGRSQEVEQLRSEVARLRSESDRAQQRLGLERQRADATRADVDRLQKERDQRAAELARATGDARAKGELQKRLAAAVAELAKKQNDLAARERQVSNLNTQVAKLREEIKTKQATTVAAAPTLRADSEATARRTAVAVGDASKFGRYHALLIGIDNYKNWDRLRNSVFDARGIAEVLQKRYGFAVEVLANPQTRADIMRKLNEYRLKLTSEDNFLLFYAGHGYLEEQNNEGYWVPALAERDNNAEWLETNAVAGQLKIFNARQILVIADSCYGGIMTRNMVAELRGGLTPEQRFENLGRLAANRPRIVMSSGGLQPVMDTGGGKHSAFTGVLLDLLGANDDLLESVRLYDAIRLRVSELARRYKFEQIPTYGPMIRSEHSSGDFVFVPKI